MMLNHFDHYSQVNRQVLGHTKVSRELDLQVMIKDLRHHDVFESIRGRKHLAFRTHQRSPVQLNFLQVLS